jgi:hypothetical protein
MFQQSPVNEPIIKSSDIRIIGAADRTVAGGSADAIRPTLFPFEPTTSPQLCRKKDYTSKETASQE